MVLQSKFFASFFLLYSCFICCGSSFLTRSPISAVEKRSTLTPGHVFTHPPLGSQSSKNKSKRKSSSSSETTTSENTGIDSSDSKQAVAWTEPRVHNSNAFRALALLGALAISGATSKSPFSVLPSQFASAVHLLSFGTWFGTVVYTTFIAGITLFKNLPRKTFGKVQSVLFPKYFALCSATLVLQLVTISRMALISPQKSIRALGIGLAVTLFNQFYLEPKSTTIMFERYRLDDLPGGPDSDKYKSLKAQFGKLHGMSSLFNLIALCTGVSHAVFLASGLAK